MKPLTEKQQQIFLFIRRFITIKGYSPCIREIMQEFGFRSPNGTVCHLHALARKGFIRRSIKLSRSITLVEDDRKNALRVLIGEADRALKILENQPHNAEIANSLRSALASAMEEV